MKRLLPLLFLGTSFVFFACQNPQEPSVDRQEDLSLEKPAGGGAGINIVLKDDIDKDALKALGKYGKVTGTIPEINAVFLSASPKKLAAIQDLPFVQAANQDAVRATPPFPQVEVSDFADGLSTWNLDAINVTDTGINVRQVEQNGTGVFVGVLDTGLLHTWRSYFPEERIAVEYARSFGGGGARGRGHISGQPNKWEHDTAAHGTHVTSTILGYSLGGVPINGVAPMATVIPVKVLNQNGRGWASVIVHGIMYIANLKADGGPLSDSPVVINMSLSGPMLDPVEEAAIDYAIAQGVIIVAAAGNAGDEGMGYPAAYQPVISVATSGWIGEWLIDPWWIALDVAEPTNPDNFYIAPFSGRELAGQDLDVAAPGSWVLGPFQLDMGHLSYFFLGGTSTSSPHVAGIVALMAQKNGTLTAADAEGILEGSAIPLAPGSRSVLDPLGNTQTFTWGADATGSGLVDAAAALTAIP